MDVGWFEANHNHGELFKFDKSPNGLLWILRDFSIAHNFLQNFPIHCLICLTLNLEVDPTKSCQ